MIKTVNKALFQGNELFEQIYNKSMTELRQQGFGFISKEDYSKICKSIGFLIDSNQINEAQEISKDVIYECFTDTEIANLDFKPSKKHICQGHKESVAQKIEETKNKVINFPIPNKKTSIKDKLATIKASNEMNLFAAERNKKQNRSADEKSI